MMKFRDNKHWHETEYGMDAGSDSANRKLTYMLQGDGFLMLNDHVKAAEAFVRQIGELKERQKECPPRSKRGVASDEEKEIIWMLSIVYNRLARAHYGQRHWDRGIISSDRAIALSNEIDNPAANAEALMALSDGYLGKCSYQDAVLYYEKAMLRFREIGDLKVGFKYSACVRTVQPASPPASQPYYRPWHPHSAHPHPLSLPFAESSAGAPRSTRGARPAAFHLHGGGAQEEGGRDSVSDRKGGQDRIRKVRRLQGEVDRGDR